VDTIAGANEGYLLQRFKYTLQKNLEQWCSQKFLIGVIKNMDTSRCSFISRNVQVTSLFYNGTRVPERPASVLQYTLPYCSL